MFGGESPAAADQREAADVLVRLPGAKKASPVLLSRRSRRLLKDADEDVVGEELGDRWEGGLERRGGGG
mgnify:CR=1 FL=1